MCSGQVSPARLRLALIRIVLPPHSDPRPTGNADLQPPKPGPLCGARLVVVQAHLKSGGGELTRENVRLMGGAVAALRREQCAAAAQEAAAAAAVAAAVTVGEAAQEEVGEEAAEAAAALVARISVLDDQSVRLTTSLTTPPPAARGASAQEIETCHREQPGLGQAWLLALGDFNLDPAQVLDEVRALELPATDLILAAPPAPLLTRCARRGYTASAAAFAGRWTPTATLL